MLSAKTASDVLLASWGRLFCFREIKQTELKGLVSSYSCTIIGGQDGNECSWAQLMRLHFWKRWGGYERAPFGIGKNGNADENIPLEMCRLRPGWSGGRVFWPLVKGEGQCASASARGSQGLWRWQEPQQQQLEPKYRPKARAQQGPASTVRIIFLLDAATVSLGHYNRSLYDGWTAFRKNALKGIKRDKDHSTVI